MTEPTPYLDAVLRALADPGRAEATRKELVGLHHGWPFSDGPLEWPLRFEYQPATVAPEQPEGLHLCCGHCGQSVTRLGEWGHTLATLKPQISLHVMQCHTDLIGC